MTTPLIESLAKLMLQRHLQVCLQKPLRDDLSKYLNDFCEAERGTSKVLAVVGAGASARASVRAGEVAQQLRKEMASGDAGYEAEIRRLKRVYNFEDEALETVLFALSRTPQGERQIRKRLAEIYKRRHPTLFVYEVLAHLLKHRFLDAIITFNFDELLDQSLDDELGKSEYVRVISERDCNMLLDHESTGQLPIYLKLHGTASDPESLKFTRDAYFSMNERLELLVRNLLGKHRCTILNVGFGMRSFDFTQLFDGPHTLTVYNFSHDRFDNRAIDEIQSARGARKVEIHEIETKHYDHGQISGTGICFDELATTLDKLCQATKGIAEFRSVTRHRLITSLLDWGQDVTSPAMYHHYLEDRTTLEVAVSAIKGRGLLPIASLARERCAGYYDRVRAELPEPLPSTANDWITTCRRGGLQPSRISNETFVSREDIRSNPPLGCAGQASDDEAELSNLTIDVRKLCERMKPHLHGQTQDAWDKYEREQVGGVVGAFKELQDGSEVEVHITGDSICSKFFREPEYLPTATSLRARTIHMLTKSAANRVAVVAETGTWLLNEAYRDLLKEKELFLIVAFSKEIENLQREFPRIQIVSARWWRHNRHMTIICKDDTPLAGIYFARRQRSLVVSPVYLDHEVDREALLKSFFTYWKRSEMTPAALTIGEIPNRFAELRAPRLVEVRRIGLGGTNSEKMA